ncbi:MAG TPA: hypothetical protein PKD95_01850 [Candidatus Paceibacterota bacterium]|nr:hypothetical protein [Candidatus Paceibacterota bacterium]
MTPLIKNITAGLVVVSLAFLGYYLYSQNKSASLSQNDNTYSNEQMLTNTQIFIERRALLDKVTLNTDILLSPVFQSYRSYRSPQISTPVGRPNPFEANSTGGI